jgi:hypothetical protein
MSMATLQQMIADPATLAGLRARGLTPADIAKHVDKVRLHFARRHASACAAYILKDEESGHPVVQAPTHQDWHQLMDTHRRMVVLAHVDSGKALALDTPIATPTGWKTMGALVVGDEVFAGDGTVTMVTFATPTQRKRDCYEVTFCDGAKLVADGDHRWLAWTADRYSKGLDTQVVTTKEMWVRGVHVGVTPQRRWRVPICRGLELPEYDLPLHPYVLGAWLGDGEAQRGRLTYHVDDRALFWRCVELFGGQGGVANVQGDHGQVRVQGVVSSSKPGNRTGLTSVLRAVGVLDDKHIPIRYLRASEAQRLELLRGLMDTDGTASKTAQNRVEFCSASLPLAEGVLELARSLGQKATLRGTWGKWRVCWTAWRQVFWLPRKAKLLKVGGLARTKRLAAKVISSIEPVASVPVRCIQVAHKQHTYLAGKSLTVTHNTQQLSIARPLYELGKNPRLRVVIVSATSKQAAKIAGTIKRYIEASPELHAVFPTLRPGSPWTGDGFTIKEQPPHIKDPSVQVVGMFGHILGARIDLLVLDDVLDFENTRTEYQRQKAYDWIKSTLFGRMTPNSRIIAVGNPWHPEDAMHRFGKEGWHFIRHPVVDANGHSTWPYRWPMARIEEAREQMGPLEFARQMLCQARSDADSRFRRTWIEWCMELARNEGVEYLVPRCDPTPGFQTFTGVDLGISRKRSGALSVLFTIGYEKATKRKTILDIQSGRWTAPEILNKISDVHTRFDSQIYVESNAAQDFIRQFAENMKVPVHQFTTGKNKKDPLHGVESLAAEMHAKRWVIPNKDGMLHPEVAAWIDEALYYDPLAHTGDRLMASWIASEGARKGSNKAAWGNVNLRRR